MSTFFVSILYQKFKFSVFVNPILPLIDLRTSTISSHKGSCKRKKKKTSLQLLDVLRWSLVGIASTISVYQSIFLYTTLQRLPEPFDPYPKAPGEAKYWSDNGPEWFS